MSKLGYLGGGSEGPFDLEITRVDCTYIVTELQIRRAMLKILGKLFYFSQKQNNKYCGLHLKNYLIQASKQEVAKVVTLCKNGRLTCIMIWIHMKMLGWLVVFGLSGPLRQYFSLYRAVSQREGERGEKGWRRVKMSKQPPPHLLQVQ